MDVQRSGQLQNHLKDRIAARASGPDLGILHELATDFFQKTAEHREAVNHHRIHSSALLPDSSGLPSNRRPLAYLKYSFVNAFKFKPQTGETRPSQAEAAATLGDFIDARIEAAGGDLGSIQATKKAYLDAKKIDDSVTLLDHSLRVFISHVRVSMKLCPTGKRDIAVAQLAETQQVIAANPDIAPNFPQLNRDDIWAPFGYVLVRAWLERNLEKSIDLLEKFQRGFNEFDVMEEHQKLWQQRRALAEDLGMPDLAKVCADVAHEYDAPRHRALDDAWNAKMVGTYEPKF